MGSIYAYLSSANIIADPEKLTNKGDISRNAYADFETGAVAGGVVVVSGVFGGEELEVVVVIEDFV